MARNIRWDESVLENALSLVEALLQLSEHQLEDLKLPLIAKWENDKLRITGFDTKKTNAKASRTVELGTKKEYLLKQIQEAGKTLKCPKHKELEEIQTVLDLLSELGVRQDNKSAKNKGYWKFAIALKHQTATVQENLEVVKHKWKEHSKTNPRKSSLTTQTASNSINWRHICGEMLNKHKRLTTDELLYTHEDMKFQFDDIHVPLALVQRTKPDKRQENITPEFGSQLIQPVEYEERQKLQHDDFLEKVLKQGIGKTQGKRIALIGEPGAGKTTLLQTIAFWIIEENLGLPIWISLADLQLQNGSFQNFDEYLRESWLPKAVSNLTPATKSDFISSFESGQVWLLLDGVDEIVGGTNSPLQVISSQLDGWIAKSCVVLTCRLNVWEANLNALNDFETFRLLDFDYPLQVKQFINNWFHLQKPAYQNPLQNKERNKKEEELWQELNKPERQRIQDLVKNPLLLALLCATWQSTEKGLPDTKAGLYHLFVKHFYSWKSNRFHTTEKQRRELNAALGDLAKQALDGESSRFRLHHEFISNLLGDPEDKGSLFWLALQLGWLNKVGIAAEADTQEEVYAFYHPTFQEYFAALGVDDWDFFLPRKHKDKPVKDKDKPSQYRRYRVFEPQWKQTIILWLGRNKNKVSEKIKEEFIIALLNFQDGCGYHYECIAYFLVAVSINEFVNYKYAEKIINILILAAFGNICLFNQSKIIRPITEAAKAVIPQTTRTIAIKFLVQLIENSNNQYYLIKIAEILGEIDYDNSIAIATLIRLIQTNQNQAHINRIIEILGKITRKNTSSITMLLNIMEKPDEFICLDTENKNFYKIHNLDYLPHCPTLQYALGEIAKHNQNIIDSLIKLVYKCKNELVHKQIAICFEFIKADSQDIVDALIYMIKNSQHKYTRRQATGSLGKITQSNPKAIATFIALLQNHQFEDEFTCILAMAGLSRTRINHLSIINTFVDLINYSENESLCHQAALSLRWIGKHSTTAAQVLVNLIYRTKEESTQLTAVESLIEIDSDNSIIIQTLINLIKTSRNEYVLRQAAEFLGKVTKEHQIGFDTLVNLIAQSQDEAILRYSVSTLVEVYKDNPMTVNILAKLVKNSSNDLISLHIIEKLSQIDKDNPIISDFLVKLLLQSQEKSLQKQAVQLLKNVLFETQSMPEIITILKGYLTDKLYNSDFERFNNCYEIIWHCAQFMIYPDFYEAWHSEDNNRLDIALGR